LWAKLNYSDTPFVNTNDSLKVKNAFVMVVFYVTKLIICNVIICRYK